ncbi:hypothetical protein N9453_01075 [Aquiluna sp.]|nr:hypothetical protein [Aquiluna sp.]
MRERGSEHLERENADMKGQLSALQGDLLDKQEKFEIVFRDLAQLDIALEESQEKLRSCQLELERLKSGPLGRFVVFMKQLGS